jgi:hypothetical protein
MRKTTGFLPALILSFLLLNCQKSDLKPSLIPSNSSINKSKSAKVVLTETQLLARKYIEWQFTRDRDSAPWFDPTGALQTLAQPYSSGVMMLGTGFIEDNPNRTVTINSSQYQYVFVPLIVANSWWSACYPGGPTNGTVPNGQLSNGLTEAFNGKNPLVLKLDGVSILPDNNALLRANTNYWTFPIDSSWDRGCTLTPNPTFYADGYWAKVPLTKGTHTLEIGGSVFIEKYKFGFTTQVNYTLIVN